MSQSIEEWAEEGCIRLRVTQGERGRVLFEVLNVNDGWPGAVMAKATLTDWRAKRVHKFMMSIQEKES
ncbi:MAG: hypothetical protein AB7G11_02335 [Phycisphaerales bacterium]